MKPRETPCGTCPYRAGVPSGLWAAAEYEKLPAYDGSTTEQAVAGAWGVFCCHSSPDELCAGWAHLADEDTLALRFAARMLDIDAAAVVAFRITAVAMHASHTAAALHGLRDIDHPDERALAAAAKLERLLTHREYPEGFTCPRCGMTSRNPDDIRDGYCGNCHDWTRDAAG